MEIMTLDNKTSLYIQVKNGIINRIRTGEMAPNSKVPSERDLARRFKISRGTAKQALQELESENYIERIPAKGSFVRDSANDKRKLFNILFPFPEVAISRDVLDYAGFAADMEMYQGMLSVCGVKNARITFQHLPETTDCAALQSQIRGMREFDGAVFLGDNQLKGFKSELRRFGISFVTVYGGDELAVQGTTIVYNRAEIIAEAANYVADHGYDSVGMLTNNSFEKTKENILASIFDERNVEFKPEWVLHVDPNEDKAYEELSNLLPNDVTKLPKLFFCASPVFSFAFLRIANDRRWRVPDDVALFGYANNTDIRPTNPVLTHVRVPYFEMGAEACRVLIEGMRGEFVVPARIVEGETVAKIVDREE